LVYTLTHREYIESLLNTNTDQCLFHTHPLKNASQRVGTLVRFIAHVN